MSEYFKFSYIIINIIKIMDCIRFWTVIFACGFILFVNFYIIIVIIIPNTQILD